MGAIRSKSAPRKEESLPAILPRPKSLSRRRGVFQIGLDTPIELPTGDVAFERTLRLAAEVARDHLQQGAGVALPIEWAPEASSAPRRIRCALDRKAAIEPRLPTARDAYRLTVSARAIEIAAPTVCGLRHGLQTLSQLSNRRGEIPCLQILDQPDFRDRGIMLDVSRGKVPTAKTLEALVDLCSALRLNVLMLYVEHTFAFLCHPEIAGDGSALDAETIRQLDAYAIDRGVELIPCLQSLGHMEHILSLPSYEKLAESDRLWSVSPSRPETYQFLRDLYDEFLPLFQSPRVNANCDEPFDLGRGQSAERAPEKLPGQLFAEHVNQLDRLAARHGKQLMIWADFALKHPEHLGLIDRSVVLMDWWYEANFDFDRIKRLRDKKFEVWVCPGTSSWNCLFPRVQNADENVARWAEAGRQHGATGFLNTDWGDFGHYNALGVSLHSYGWGAQQAWSGGEETREVRDEFDRAFSQRVFGEKSPRISKLYRKLGAVHDAGFKVANGSALQYLYFDALDKSFFLQHAKTKALEGSLRKIERVRRDIDGLGLADSPHDFIGLARHEIAWAAEATHLSITKSLAALEYNLWRSEFKTLKAAERRHLAGRLERIADDQQGQLTALSKLWRARSERSDFHKTQKRIRGSIASLRRGAKRLIENNPGKPPPTSDIAMLEIFNEVRRAYGMAPRAK